MNPKNIPSQLSLAFHALIMGTLASILWHYLQPYLHPTLIWGLPFAFTVWVYLYLYWKIEKIRGGGG